MIAPVAPIPVQLATPSRGRIIRESASVFRFVRNHALPKTIRFFSNAPREHAPSRLKNLYRWFQTISLTTQLELGLLFIGGSSSAVVMSMA